MKPRKWLLFAACWVCAPTEVFTAQVCNVTVVSDSRPDFSDLPSFIRSVTAPYSSTDEQCKAIWRWLTRCRRQTPHSLVHGVPVHDPIMFFNDFGYGFCSDYAGINCGIWHSMGLPVRFWDITLHTVSECFYDGRWHMFDNSMSAYYTLCDGITVAGVEDIGAPGACEASHGRTENGHIGLVHAVGATSPYGFLTGADTQRSLRDEALKCFNPKGLKYRNYYNGFELGHRYVLCLREGETYTRYASPLGQSEDYYIPLQNGKSPQNLGTFGNGLWVYRPDLGRRETTDDFFAAKNIALANGTLRADKAGAPAEAVLLINGANMITSSTVRMDVALPAGADSCAIAVSTNLGTSWSEVWKSTGPMRAAVVVPLRGVKTLHQFLVKISLAGAAEIRNLETRTVTQINKLTLPILTLGANTIDVLSAATTQTLLLWPEIQNNKFKESCCTSENVASGPASDWHGCLWLETPGTGHLTYAIEAPGDLTEVTYGGRFYNRAPKSSIALEHSTNNGKTWVRTWELTETKAPWDDIHFETVRLGSGVRRVLVRYTLASPSAGRYDGCSIYSIRMIAGYRPRSAQFKPIEVTYCWSEWQGGQWVARSHTQQIRQPAERYRLYVGGEDLPRTDSICVALAGTTPNVRYGYSDGAAGQLPPLARKRYRWGRNLALGCKYSFSKPSDNNWGGGDPDMTKLTDESVASTYGMGTTYREGPIWGQDKNPVITLDLATAQTVAAVRIHATGYPCDFYNGPFCTIEVLTSADGNEWTSQGKLETRMRYKDVDGDFIMPENGKFQSWVFPLIFPHPVAARYIQYKIANPKMVFNCSEIMAYDSVKVEEWNEPLAMPLDDKLK
ncbi:MAG: discoidin domain-containing protein [Candidatus Sumerlaeia bacterium]|nr:discoidin domain-containing protein [Candidatus Sumerlaeia bacterium]